MTLYRLKKGCGDHVEVDEQGKSHNIKAGERFESHRDLIAKFCKGNPHRGKFERVYPDDVADHEIPDDAPNIPTLEPIPGAAIDKGGADSDTASPTIHPEFGEDITSEFPLAIEKEVKVYIKKHWCQIIDEDMEDGDEVLTESKLRRKNVNAFLVDLEEVEEDEED